MIDRLSLLFDLFGSDADFIEEYENILAEKFLLSRVTDINEEIKNIELLKLRFGETKMLRSTVIMRDVNDSHRFNHNYQEDLKASRQPQNQAAFSPTHSRLLFVSSGFWPVNSEVSHFEYPEAFGKVFEQVHAQFKKHKHIMSLKHHNNLGSVELELTFRNGQKGKFRCEPVQAAIISLFDKTNNPQQASLSVDFIAERLQAHANYIKTKIFYWIKRGVLQELNKKAAAS